MENDNIEMNNNKKMTIILIGITVLLTLSAVLVTTYAFFNYTRTGAPNIMKTGKIDLIFEDGENNLNLTNQFPITDIEAYDKETKGEEVTITDFTVTGYSTSSQPLKYKISAVKGNVESSKNRFPDNQVKLYLVGETDGKGSFTILNGYNTSDTTNGVYGALASVGNNGVDTKDNGEIQLATGEVAKEETTHTYTLRMWISDTVKISDTESDFAYCASVAECNDDRKIYSTMYYSLKIKVENIEME